MGNTWPHLVRISPKDCAKSSSRGYPLSIAPLSLCRHPMTVHGQSITVSLAVPPLPPVHTLVGPRESAFSALHILLILAFVDGPVGPLHLSETVNMACMPLTRVGSPVNKLVPSFAIHLVLAELALINDACCGGVLPLAVFATVQKFTLIACSVGPTLDTFSRFFVLMPFSFIGASVNVNILSVSMRTVLIPLPLISISVRGRADAVSVGSAIAEVTLVSLPVGPGVDTITMPFAASPLTSVQRSTLHLDFCFLTMEIPH
mmetsp:Transcript_63932/g.169205  ORF Transcript_63932/g.169205 Transcript_63932/m.169205 type:complete len:260 (+) Transcript_63932:238-1017(+)